MEEVKKRPSLGDIAKKGDNLRCDKFTFDKMIKGVIFALQNKSSDEDIVGGMSGTLLNKIYKEKPSTDMENAFVEVNAFVNDVILFLKDCNVWEADKLAAKRRWLAEEYDSMLVGQRLRKRAKLQELHAKGLNDREISEALGVTTTTVANWRHQLGLSANKKSKTE